MDYSEISFISYNSTGLDSVKVRWIRDLLDTFNTDFIQIQEHFKSNKGLDSYFKQNFPSFDRYVVPGHREPFQDSGRPKGGLAHLNSQKKKLKMEKIPTKKLETTDSTYTHWHLQNDMD